MLVENISKLCQKNGISIFALERELGIGNGVIARWKGSSPKLSNIQRVADYFGVTLDDLTKGGENVRTE